MNDWTWMESLIGPVAALAGVIVGAAVHARQARKAELRENRRAFYTEMLSLLIGRRAATETISFAPDSPPPPDLDQERVALHDARLALEASDDVRRLGQDCFKLMQRFWASYTMGAPIRVDEQGFFHYQFELVRGVPKETADLHMRVSLGGVHDELVKAIDALSAQMRKELQGSR